MRRTYVNLCRFFAFALACSCADASGESLPALKRLPPVPANLTTEKILWWESRDYRRAEAIAWISPTDLITDALQQAPEVLAIQAETQAERQAIGLHDAAFDWSGFVETTWNSVRDPIGSLLDTGLSTGQLIDHTVQMDTGLRRNWRGGTATEIVARNGYQQNNSTFLLPNPQSTTRLELGITQPLMRGSDSAYVNRHVVLAQLAHGVSGQQLAEQMQQQALKITEGYWSLYAAQCRERILRRQAKTIKRYVAIIEDRHEVDVDMPSLLRANAELHRAEAQLPQAVAAVQQAVVQLLEASGRPLDLPDRPLVARQLPPDAPPPSDGRALAEIALENRPEVTRAIQRVRMASVQVQTAQHELLPKMDLIGRAYLASLAGGTSLISGFDDVLEDADPTLRFGLQVDAPLSGRAARHRLSRARWESEAAINRYENTIRKTITEVASTLAGAQGTYESITLKIATVRATRLEANNLEDRWQSVPWQQGGGRALLDALLDAQQRLSESELSLLSSQVDYAIALARLAYSQGTLLRAVPLPIENG